IPREFRPIYLCLLIRGETFLDSSQSEPRDGAQCYHHPPVVAFREGDKPSRATDIGQPVVNGLDHANQPVIGFQRVVKHLKITGLENMQWQLGARQHDRLGQRKQRDPRGQIEPERHHAKISEESRRRPFWPIGSFGLRLSKIVRSCALAAPSFHSRSRRKLSRSVSTASST